MLKHFKLFEQHSEYESYINSKDKLLPNLSFCKREYESHLKHYFHDVSLYGDIEGTTLKNYYLTKDSEPFYINNFITPGYAVNDISIFMDNNDITENSYENYNINISDVTADISINIDTASVTNSSMFIKRTTGNGINIQNNKALLKRVQGNSLLFAQRIRSYNFTDGTLGDWTIARGTYSIADGILSVTGPSSNTPLIYVKPANNPVYTSASHKYLQCAKVRITNFAEATSRPIFIGSNSINGGSLTIKDNDWHIVSGTLTTGSTAPSGNARWFQVYVGSGAGTAFDLEWVQCFDLTVLGAPEISSYAEFIKRFPLLPYPYNSSAILLNNSMTNYISKRYDAVGVAPTAYVNNTMWAPGGTGTALVPDANGVYTLTVASNNRITLRTKWNLTSPSGHSFYMRCYVKANTGKVYFMDYGGSQVNMGNVDGTFKLFSALKRVGNRPDFAIFDGTINEEVYFKLPLYIDLTAMFGAGNEPTLAECDVIFDNLNLKSAADFDDWNILQNANIDVGGLTGKLNGEGDSVVVFPNNANMPYTSQVEYIQKTSTDRGYFAAPYICTGTDIVIKAKFNYQGWCDSSGSFQHVFGTWVSNSVSAYRLVQAGTNTTKFYSMLCSNNYAGASGNYAANTDIEVEMSYGQTIINGTTITYSPTQGTTNTSRIMIFNNIKAKLYYFQVYKANVLVVDVIPVRIGNKAGLYDKVAGELLDYKIVDEQEPTLIAGNDVPNSFTYGMKSTVCLPSVTPDFIYKSDSKASYFDLDYVPTGNDIVIKTKIRYNSYINTTYYLPWFTTKTSGWNEILGDNFYGILRRTNTDGNIYAFCGNKNYTEITGLTTATVYEIELSNGNLKLNGTDYTLDTSAGNENTYSMKLLAGLNAYLYYYQIYKGEDLVVDCIPYRDANVIGLYDRARDRIFTLTQVNGEGSINSYEPTYEELPDPTYDEIKQDNGIWKAYKRISNTRVNNSANTGRGEYVPLAQEEVYILDDQSIPTVLNVVDQGIEEILPVNGTTPVTAPTIMEIQYGSTDEN